MTRLWGGRRRFQCRNLLKPITVNNTTCIKAAKLKLGNMFRLQRAIIRPTTERSPGTFDDCALYGIPYRLLVVHSMGSHIVYWLCILWDPISFIGLQSMGSHIVYWLCILWDPISFIGCAFYGILYRLLICTLWDPISFIDLHSMGSHIVYWLCILWDPISFIDCALYGIPYSAQSLNVPQDFVLSLAWRWLVVAETCCQVFNFADLIHVVSLTVINVNIITKHNGMAPIKINVTSVYVPS